MQSRIATALRHLGAAIEHVEYDPAEVPMVGEFAAPGAMEAGRRAALLGRFAGRGGGRSLILFAHPDCEPVAGTERWRYDAFAGALADGRLYGWGAADDLTGIAIMVEALSAVQEAGALLGGDVIVASTPSKRHARGVAALLHAGLSADAAIYLHPAESGAGLAEIKAFASGQVEFRVTVAGRPPPTTEPLQTAFAHLAVNPIEKALLVVAALQALDARRAPNVRHPALDAAVGRSTNLMLSHLAAGEPDRLARSATECVVGGALSFPPPETLASVSAVMETAIGEACAADPWLRDHPARLSFVSGVTGAETPADHPLFRTAAEAVLAVTGAPPRVNPMHTASDIRVPIVQAGIPTIGLGPLCGDLAQNGGTDEWIDVEDYLRTIRVTARIVAAWCGT